MLAVLLLCQMHPHSVYMHITKAAPLGKKREFTAVPPRLYGRPSDSRVVDIQRGVSLLLPRSITKPFFLLFFFFQRDVFGSVASGTTVPI